MTDFDDEFEIPRHWEKRSWYRKHPLHEREEDNLIEDEIERCGKQD